MTKRNPIGIDQLLPEIDYGEYVFSKKEITLHILSCALFTAMVSWIFYDSVIAWIFLMPLSLFSFREQGKIQCQRRKRRLEIEFREVILSVSSNLLNCDFTARRVFHTSCDFCSIASVLKPICRDARNAESVVAPTAVILYLSRSSSNNAAF